MAELTPEARRSYWRFNVRLTVILLATWFGVAYLLAGVLAARLNAFELLGVPLGYWIAAQGSVLVFVAEAALYARLMNARDLKSGIREEG